MREHQSQRVGATLDAGQGCSAQLRLDLDYLLVGVAESWGTNVAHPREPIAFAAERAADSVLKRTHKRRESCSIPLAF